MSLCGRGDGAGNFMIRSRSEHEHDAADGAQRRDPEPHEPDASVGGSGVLGLHGSCGAACECAGCCGRGHDAGWLGCGDRSADSGGSKGDGGNGSESGGWGRFDRVESRRERCRGGHGVDIAGICAEAFQALEHGLVRVGRREVLRAIADVAVKDLWDPGCAGIGRVAEAGRLLGLGHTVEAGEDGLAVAGDILCGVAGYSAGVAGGCRWWRGDCRGGRSGKWGRGRRRCGCVGG